MKNFTPLVILVLLFATLRIDMAAQGFRTPTFTENSSVDHTIAFATQWDFTNC